MFILMCLMIWLINTITTKPIDVEMKPIDVKDNTYAEYNEDLLEVFMKKNYQKTNQKEFRTEKVFKKKGDKLYVKWKGYDNSFNSWIDKKDLI